MVVTFSDRRAKRFVVFRTLRESSDVHPPLVEECDRNSGEAGCAGRTDDQTDPAQSIETPTCDAEAIDDVKTTKVYSDNLDPVARENQSFRENENLYVRRRAYSPNLAKFTPLDPVEGHNTNKPGT